MKDVILYNKINKIESDLANFSTSFDPTTLPNNIDFFYEGFMYNGVSNLNSSANPSYSNFTSDVNTVSGTSPIWSLGQAQIGNSYFYKPYLRVLGSSVGGYLTRYAGISPSLLPYMTTTYGNNLEITFKTTISIDSYLTERRFSIGLGVPTQSSGVLGGNGIYFRFSQNSNSGNVQLCQLKGGVVTAIDSVGTLSANTRYYLKIVFNTQTNIVYFYLNEALLGQATVDISHTTLVPFYHIQSLSATQATGSIMFIHNIFMQNKFL